MMILRGIVAAWCFVGALHLAVYRDRWPQDVRFWSYIIYAAIAAAVILFVKE